VADTGTDPVTISDGLRTILDANDCKMFGLPLQQVLADHPSIDFALRSHSNASAYPYCIEDYETLCPELRPRTAYMDEFAAFAKKVGARHAIPFASNHCFLHPETRHFNGVSVKPTEVKRRFDELVARGEMQGSECVIMAPGSSWSTENGFDLVAFDYDNVEDYIDKLSVRHGETIARQLTREAETELDEDAFVRYFERFAEAIPKLAGRKLGIFEMRVVEHGIERPFNINSSTGEVVEGSADDPTFSVRCEALIINDCVRFDMFSVWTPSKRLSVRVRDRASVGAVLTFFALLDGVELEYRPVRKNFDRRMLRSSIRRWREPVEAARTALSTRVLRRPFVPW
jgi:UDP-MurNAc hydroxylase